MLIIGLDPGASGGIAWQLYGLSASADAEKFGETETDIAGQLKRCMELDSDWFAYLERVGATPQMGVTSAFTFGKNYGLLRGLLIGLGIPFEEVTPVTWQKEFGLRMKGKQLGQADVDKHNAIKAAAQQRFPHVKMTHSKAAALLICEWGTRQRAIRAMTEYA